MDDSDPDAFGRAIRDHHRGNRDEPLRQCDGPARREHPIEEFYFGDYDPKNQRGRRLEEWLSGPLLDLGAGAGRDTLHFQDRFETVALERSPALVETMRDRGVADAREGDMFALPAAFDRDRFGSVLAYGTQVGLAGSLPGLRAFLADLDRVTEPGATAVIDSYDPTVIDPEALLGYRRDPAPGLCHRVMWFEYGDRVDPVLRFRLFSPARLREVAVGTGWAVTAVARSEPEAMHYLARLESR